MKFPHFSRLFSAGTFPALQHGIHPRVRQGILMAGIGSLILINTLSTPSPYLEQLITTLSKNANEETYITLAKRFDADGLLLQAHKVLLLGQEQFATLPLAQNVLGTTTTKELLREIDERPARLLQQYEYWKKITEEKPDYRDAWAMTATLAYQLGKLEEARTYLTHAIALDPNATRTQKLSSTLEAH